MLIAIVATAALVGGLITPATTAGAATSWNEAVTAEPRPEGADCRVSRRLVPSCGAFWGAFSRQSDEEAGEPIDAYRALEADTGKKLDVVHYYFSGTQIWPPQWMIELADEPGRERILAINWKPEAGKTWAQVAAGGSDWYIDREAEYLRANFTDRFYLTIHHEPEEEVRTDGGSGYTAEDYRNMYRHVVDRLRSQGVDNAVMVMNYMGFQGWGLQDWYDDLWPGDAYADWIAFDPYASATHGDQDRGFRWMINRHWGETDWRGKYRWAVEHHPGVPIMLGEWGVGEKAGDPGWKGNFFGRVGRRLDHFPALKAMLYFDTPYASSAGDVRLNTSPESLAGARWMLEQDVWAPQRR